MKKAWVIGHYTSKRALKNMEDDKVKGRKVTMIAVVNNVDKKEQRVKNVFRVILSKSNIFLCYAQAHAQLGLSKKGKALRETASVVLENTRWWRGDEARRCKKVLKEYGGVS